MFFSCKNVYQGPRKLFEHEVARQSVQTSPEGPANVNAMKQTCRNVINYSGIIYHILTKITLKTPLKH